MIQLRHCLVYAGIVNSAKVCALSPTVQLFFRNLLHACDGRGRFLADAAELRLALYARSPGVQTSHVEAWMRTIFQAGLVDLYTVGGKGYGEVLNYRQRNETPTRYPEPEPDQLDFTGSLAKDRMPEPAKAGRIEQNINRREEKGAKLPKPRKARLSLSPSKNLVEESHEEFAERLAAAYPKLDLLAQERACRKFCERHQKVFEREYFERWLANASETISRPIFSPKKPQKTAEVESGPEGWDEVIRETKYGPEGAFAVASWDELPTDVQTWVKSQLVSSP